MDALDDADRAAFERHLARCESCAREFRGLSAASARLAEAAAAAPPEGLRDRVLARAAQTRQLPPEARQPARRYRRAGRARPRPGWVLAAGLASLAAAVVLVVTATLGGGSGSPGLPHSEAVAAVLTAPDAQMTSALVTRGGKATVVMSASEHALVFTAARLPRLPPGRAYELWLIGRAGEKPAGMLPPPRHGMTGPVMATGLQPGERLGLSVEPMHGAKRPTTPMLLDLAL
jgi:anti-sigma-K factor RskA